jgi:transcriptional regulator with XRE-family HTH domain
MSQSLGELIRERRLGRGLSLGQLANAVSTSANQVRRWERGEEAPAEDARAVLADFLGIDADVLPVESEPIQPTLLAEFEEPESPTELVSAAAGVSLESVAQPEKPAEVAEPMEIVEPIVDPDPTEPEAIEVLTVPSDQVVADVEELTSEPESLPVDDRQYEPEPALVVEEPVPAAIDPAAPRPVPLRYPESAPIGVAVEIAESAPNPWNPLRYIYDPEKPWLYWIRAALILIVMLILMNILFDSVAELFDKIGEVFDSIEPVDGVEPVEEEAIAAVRAA